MHRLLVNGQRQLLMLLPRSEHILYPSQDFAALLFALVLLPMGYCKIMRGLSLLIFLHLSNLGFLNIRIWTGL